MKISWNFTPKYKIPLFGPCSGRILLFEMITSFRDELCWKWKYFIGFPPYFIALALKIFYCVSNIRDVTSVKMFPTALQQYKFSRTPPVYDLLLCKAFIKFSRNTFKPSNFTHLQLFIFIIKYWEQDF